MTHESSVWAGHAPAKVNLRLTVLEREASGYHRIETVFQQLELADRVELTVGGEGVRGSRVDLEVEGVAEGTLGPDADNLAVRAAGRFLQALDGLGGPSSRAVELVRSGVSIRLEKRIPHGAGLGGGSSDAAAVFRGLNELAGAPFGAEELMGIGSELGADVPVFLSGASRALGLGRGDEIVPLPPLPPRHVLLAAPEEGIATAWAYGVLARGRETGTIPASDPDPTLRRAAASEDWGEVAAAARNDFETALFPLRPELARLKEALLVAGARPALLSGSGAVVFGVFEDASSAERAAADVGALDDGVRVIRTRTAGRER